MLLNKDPIQRERVDESVNDGIFVELQTFSTWIQYPGFLIHECNQKYKKTYPYR
jgi:hypothetical protein